MNKTDLHVPCLPVIFFVVSWYLRPFWRVKWDDRWLCDDFVMTLWWLGPFSLLSSATNSIIMVSPQEGVGDTNDSFAYDGHRVRKWNVSTAKYGEVHIYQNVLRVLFHFSTYNKKNPIFITYCFNLLFKTFAATCVTWKKLFIINELVIIILHIFNNYSTSACWIWEDR